MSCGVRGVFVELFAVQDGELVELPVGDITELVPIEEGAGDFIYYMMGGERLAVSWESFPGTTRPAELVGIYVWNSFKEQFVPDPTTEQPTIQQ